MERYLSNNDYRDVILSQFAIVKIWKKTSIII